MANPIKIMQKGRPRQFGETRITCADWRMIKMLDSKPGAPIQVTEKQLEEARHYFPRRTALYVFNSQSVLYIGEAKNEFLVSCNIADGSDALAGFEELYMFDDLRLARDRFEKLKKTFFHPQFEGMTLRADLFPVIVNAPMALLRA